jgi:glycosyltransferase involved in cell wall biosynthesis
VLTDAGIEHELLVVDDGSNDATASVARREGAVVISHPQNLGYGQSLKTGILHARHERIAMTDADGTYPAERLPELIALADRYHMVVGQRIGRAYQGGTFKRLGRFAFRWLSEFATGRAIPDINSGLRVFSRAEILPFFPSISTGFSFTTTVTLVYLLNGLWVHYVPVEYHARVGTSKIRYFRDTLRALQIITEAILSYNPIKVFLLAACPLGVLSAILLVFSLVLRSSTLGLMALVALCTAGLIVGQGFLAVSLAPSRRISAKRRLEVALSPGSGEENRGVPEAAADAQTTSGP